MSYKTYKNSKTDKFGEKPKLIPPHGGYKKLLSYQMATVIYELTKLKLVGIARASLAELLADYIDFLRQKRLKQWEKDSAQAREIRGLAYRSDKSYKTYKRGFTLIEIILAISISSILLWQGLVRYNEFNRRQQVEQAAQDFVSVLRNAQNRAITGDKPASGCSKLEGFQVSPTLSSNTYYVAAVCDGGALVERRTESLRSKFVKFSAGSTITFSSLYGTSNGASFTISHIVAGVAPATITVSEGGSISCTGCD